MKLALVKVLYSIPYAYLDHEVNPFMYQEIPDNTLDLLKKCLTFQPSKR